MFSDPVTSSPSTLPFNEVVKEIYSSFTIKLVQSPAIIDLNHFRYITFYPLYVFHITHLRLFYVI